MLFFITEGCHAKSKQCEQTCMSTIIIQLYIQREVNYIYYNFFGLQRFI